MNVPADATIAREKLTQYLLAPRARNDKSRFLARAGFTQANPDALEAALRRQAAAAEAQIERQNVHGIYLNVRGNLHGPRGTLQVVTVWIMLATNGECRFVTLKPVR